MEVELSALTVRAILFFTLAGSVMGSFACCAAVRIVKGTCFYRGRSVCDHCGHALGWYDLIPLFSYLCLKGRCRYCGEKISSASFWAELICAIVFAVLVVRFGFTKETVCYASAAVVLLTASLVDLASFIIPDGCVIILILLRLLYLFAAASWKQMLVQGIIGGVLVYGVMYCFSQLLNRILRQPALGGGDLKLMLAMGFYLGPLQVWAALLAACFAGVVSVSLIRQRKIPFGPSLSFGMMFALLAGEQLMARCLHYGAFLVLQ